MGLHTCFKDIYTSQHEHQYKWCVRDSEIMHNNLCMLASTHDSLPFATQLSQLCPKVNIENTQWEHWPLYLFCKLVEGNFEATLGWTNGIRCWRSQKHPRCQAMKVNLELRWQLSIPTHVVEGNSWRAFLSKPHDPDLIAADSWKFDTHPALPKSVSIS